jgi:hypothetical protein
MVGQYTVWVVRMSLPIRWQRGPPLLELRVVAFVADGADVVHQRVEPHVADVVLVEGQLDAPGQPAFGPRDAEVLQRLAQEAQGLVAADSGWMNSGCDWMWPISQSWYLAHLEEVVGLLDALDVGQVLRLLALGQVLLGDKGLAGHVVPAVVVSGVDVAAVVEVLENGLHDAGVARLSGADEVVVLDLHEAQQRAEVLAELVAVRLRADAPQGRAAQHLLAVLIGAGEHPHVVAAAAVPAAERVGGDRGVGVADVGLVVDVVDRRGDVEPRQMGGLMHQVRKRLKRAGVQKLIQQTRPVQGVVRPGVTQQGGIGLYETASINGLAEGAGHHTPVMDQHSRGHLLHQGRRNNLHARTGIGRKFAQHLFLHRFVEMTELHPVLRHRSTQRAVYIRRGAGLPIGGAQVAQPPA